MIARFFIFAFVALAGLCSFITAIIFLVQGHNAEWITLILAPVSGICLAIVMNFADIDLRLNLTLLAKDGRVSLKIDRV